MTLPSESTSLPNPCVWVCQHQSCYKNGAAKVLAVFQHYAPETVTVKAVECQGQCNLGPIVRVLPDEVWYCRVKPESVPEIVESHLQQGKPVRALLHPRLHPQYQYWG